jgi:hypothetical protein
MSDEGISNNVTQQLNRIVAGQDASASLRTHVFALLRDQMVASEMSFDVDDDIVFRYQGRHFMAVFDRRDDRYLRIVFSPFHQASDSDDILKSLTAIALVNFQIKGAKLWAHQNLGILTVAASVELWLVRDEDLDENFMERLISTLFTVVHEFRSLISG